MDSEWDVTISVSSLLCSFVRNEGHVTGRGKAEPRAYKEVFCIFLRDRLAVGSRAEDAGVFLPWREALSPTHLEGFVWHGFAVRAWDRLELCAFVATQENDSLFCINQFAFAFMPHVWKTFNFQRLYHYWSHFSFVWLYAWNEALCNHSQSLIKVWLNSKWFII